MTRTMAGQRPSGAMANRVLAAGPGARFGGERYAWLAGAALSAGAGLIHLALGPAHLEALGPLGLGFFLAATLQIAWAATTAVAVGRRSGGLGRRPLRLLAGSGVVINAGILGAWVVSRMVGLPAGQPAWTPEAVGLSDGIAALFEAGLVAGLGLALMRASRGRARGASGRRSSLPSVAAASFVMALVAVATITAVSAGGHAHAGDREGNSAAPGHGHAAEPAHGHAPEPAHGHAAEPAHGHAEPAAAEPGHGEVPAP